MVAYQDLSGQLVACRDRRLLLNGRRSFRDLSGLLRFDENCLLNCACTELNPGLNAPTFEKIETKRLKNISIEEKFFVFFTLEQIRLNMR
jgi:hypothetical protein